MKYITIVGLLLIAFCGDTMANTIVDQVKAYLSPKNMKDESYRFRWVDYKELWRAVATIKDERQRYELADYVLSQYEDLEIDNGTNSSLSAEWLTNRGATLNNLPIFAHCFPDSENICLRLARCAGKMELKYEESPLRTYYRKPLYLQSQAQYKKALRETEMYRAVVEYRDDIFSKCSDYIYINFDEYTEESFLSFSNRLEKAAVRMQGAERKRLFGRIEEAKKRVKMQEESLMQYPVEGFENVEEAVVEIESCFADDRLYSDETFISVLGEKTKRCHVAVSVIGSCKDEAVKKRMEGLVLECLERFDPCVLTNSCGSGFRHHAVERATYLGSVLQAARTFKVPSPEVLRRIAKRLREISCPSAQQEESVMKDVYEYRQVWLNWINGELDILQRKRGFVKTKELAAELCDLMNADKEECEKVFKRFK